MMLLKVFGFIALFFAIAALGLFVVMTGAESRAGGFEGHPGLMLGLIFTTLLVIVATFVPYLNFAMRRSFVFAPPDGARVLSEAALREEITAINHYRVPITVVRKGRKLVLGWKYADDEVRGLLAKQRLRQTYELHIGFDDARKEAILTDVKRSFRSGTGPDTVRLGIGFTRGYLVGTEIGQAWNIRSDLSIGKAYAFRFDPEEIKRPVVNTIVQSGWTVRFAMW